MAYMLAQAEADVASACVVLHLKICHLSQMGFYNVLGKKFKFQLEGHTLAITTDTYSAPRGWPLGMEMFSPTIQYSQQIPD